MARVGVALLAEERHRGRLQLEVVRAVRRVAVEAVLAHRRVLPEERAALLGVALVAELVDRAGDQVGLGQRAVRVVAGQAVHLALAHGVVRGLLHLRAHVLVALEAGLGLHRGADHRIGRGRGVDLVAVQAADALALVRTAHPVRLRGVVAVAGQADLACLGGREPARIADVGRFVALEVLGRIAVAARARRRAVVRVVGEGAPVRARLEGGHHVLVAFGTGRGQAARRRALLRADRRRHERETARERDRDRRDERTGVITKARLPHAPPLP